MNHDDHENQAANAIGYCRFSPRPGEDECQSNEQQRQAIIAYCQQRGYNLLDVMMEPSTSGGYKEEKPDPMEFYRSRPVLFRAIELCHRGMVLVVRNRDRVARSQYAQAVVRMELVAKGASWEATAEPNDNTPEGRLLQQMLAAVAEYERWKIKIATARAMQAHQSAGRRMSRSDRIPYGYCLDPLDGALIVQCAEEQENIRLAVAYRAEHPDDRIPDICRYLDRMGRTCRGRSWSQFGYRAVAKMLKNATA